VKDFKNSITPMKVTIQESKTLRVSTIENSNDQSHKQIIVGCE
jgi:hypothetical protein